MGTLQTHFCSRTRGVSPCLEGKQRTPLSSQVATRFSWSPLSGLKGVKPPVEFGERTRDCSPGHAGKEGHHLVMKGASRGFSRAAASCHQSKKVHFQPVTGAVEGDKQVSRVGSRAMTSFKAGIHSHSGNPVTTQSNLDFCKTLDHFCSVYSCPTPTISASLPVIVQALPKMCS